ncbi:AMP-binding protein [Candidatus Babeliales bacterium]|nr:AMP-binding protein [Candidatus Babeliales bacterium]
MVLTDLLEKNSQKYPNNPAFSMKMEFRTINFTYKDVYECAQKAALFLKSNNLKKGDRILIFAPNSPYWGILFWGCLLQGIIVIPINVQSTGEQIKKIIDQTNSQFIFKSKYLKRELPENLKIFEIEYLSELIESFDIKDFEKPNINENDIVEILYTSGTTGDPKGVLLTHKNIASNVIGISKIFDLKPGQEKILSVLPLTHIFEQTIGFFMSTHYVAHIVYAHSYAAILDLLDQYKITKMLVVPEFLRIFMSKIKVSFEKSFLNKIFKVSLKFTDKLNNKIISRTIFYPVIKKFGGKLDTFASGGAFLDPKLEKEWNALGFYIIQGYGLTETSPVVTCNTFKEHKFGSVGKAIEKVEIKLKEDGEILVKGPNVFQGYFNNEEKTKESFTDDGWFKTGDMGFLDKDNFLFLKGRKKYMIKGAGGQNVFPEDIELELNEIEGVKDSCVVGIPEQSGQVDIHAVLLLEDKKLNPENIIQKANKNLSSYQKITSCSVWPKQDFERSATRKIKKDIVLKQVLAARNGQSYDDTDSKSTKIISILSQVTGVPTEKISDNSNITRDLRIDSLMLVELALRIEQDYGVILDASLIKEDTTVKQLEDIIKTHEPVQKIELSKWPRSWWAYYIRRCCQFMLILFSKIFAKVEVEGLENLKNLKQPVIFMPNHTTYVDPLAILMALPKNIRKKVSFAAAKDVLYETFGNVSWLADLLFNSFCLPRKNGDGIKFGLENVGNMLDQGYSVVVFPEGEMSESSKLLNLKKGTGFMSVEMGVDIVPIKITGASDIVPYGKFFPRKTGKIIVKFASPIRFKKSDSYKLAREKIEKILKSL